MTIDIRFQTFSVEFDETQKKEVTTQKKIEQNVRDQNSYSEGKDYFSKEKNCYLEEKF